MAPNYMKQTAFAPFVRIQRDWFWDLAYSDSFRNEGTLHLFSFTALFALARFRAGQAKISGREYAVEPGQHVGRISFLRRALRACSKEEALSVLDSFRGAGLLEYSPAGGDPGVLRLEIPGWKRWCEHPGYNYYSRTGSGFFFFPVEAGKRLLLETGKRGRLLFSELDAVVDLWIHTVLDDPSVRGSRSMPVVYYSGLDGSPLLSCSYLADRWGWSKMAAGRFLAKLEREGVICRLLFSGKLGTVLSPAAYRETLWEGCRGDCRVRRTGEILGTVRSVYPGPVPDTFLAEIRDGGIRVFPGASHAKKRPLAEWTAPADEAPDAGLPRVPDTDTEEGSEHE